MSSLQEFSGSDILSDDDQLELFQIVTSQEINGILKDDHGIITMGDQNVQLLPIPADGVLSNEEYPGPHEFEVTIRSSKKPWAYSSRLNKVYIPMTKQFPIDFKIKNRPDKQLYIRATPQYCEEQHAADLVMRCINHEYSADPTNKDILEDVRQHVIRCANKFSQYLGNKQEAHRFSIIFPFSMPQAGVEGVREWFSFVCMTSCPDPGMARRGMEVIFTLEDESGDVLGRKSLNARICARPHRDMEKEEEPPRGKKRKEPKQPPAHSGKVLAQTEELKDYVLPFKITGKHNVQKIITIMEDLNTAEILRHMGQPAEKKFKRNLKDLQEYKSNLQ